MRLVRAGHRAPAATPVSGDTRYALMRGYDERAMVAATLAPLLGLALIAAAAFLR